MTDARLPMFKISADIFDSISVEDIDRTATDMGELGIYKPPFAEFFIQVKMRFMERLAEAYFNQPLPSYLSPKAELRFKYKFDENRGNATPYISPDGKEFFHLNAQSVEKAGIGKQFFWMSDMAVRVLVVLLSTKNISKEIKSCNKPFSRDRREKELSKYSSVTTIKIGSITETMRSSGNSGPVRPHLRRGHIRSQHYGKGNAEVKKIFIQPVFVNADQGWIDSQKEYRVVA